MKQLDVFEFLAHSTLALMFAAAVIYRSLVLDDMSALTALLALAAMTLCLIFASRGLYRILRYLGGKRA